MFSLKNKNNFYFLSNPKILYRNKRKKKSASSCVILTSLLDFKIYQDIKYSHPNSHNMYNLMFNILSSMSSESIENSGKRIEMNANIFIKRKDILFRDIIIKSIKNRKVITHPTFIFNDNLKKEYYGITTFYYKIYDYIFLGFNNLWRPGYDDESNEYMINIRLIKEMTTEYKESINKKAISNFNNNNDYIKIDKNDLYNILEVLIEILFDCMRDKLQNDFYIKFILSKKIKMEDMIRNWIKIYYLGSIIDSNRKDFGLFYSLILGVEHKDINTGEKDYEEHNIVLDFTVLRTNNKIKFDLNIDLILNNVYNQCEISYDNTKKVLQKKKNKNNYNISISDVFDLNQYTRYKRYIDFVDKVLDSYSDKNKMCIMNNKISA